MNSEFVWLLKCENNRFWSGLNIFFKPRIGILPKYPAGKDLALLPKKCKGTSEQIQGFELY